MVLKKIIYTRKYRILIHRLKRMLSAPRILHSKRVANISYVLAQRYGENIEYAWIAGYLHDMCREMDLEEMYNRALKSKAIINRNLDEYFGEEEHRILFHGFAAIYEIHTLQPLCTEIYLAILSHTLGAPNPTQLQKILFVADALDPQRGYWNRGEHKDIFHTYSLDTQVIRVIDFMEKKYGSIHRITEIMRDSIMG